MPLNEEHRRLQYKVYFKPPHKTKEYLLINYLIKKQYQVIEGMSNHYDELMIFTVPNRDRSTVDKCDMKPHYVLCSVDKLNLVLYSCDDDGG